MTPGESHNEWYQYYCSNICPFKIVFILAKSTDLNEMLNYAAFNLGLPCLPKYLFIGMQNEES